MIASVASRLGGSRRAVVAGGAALAALIAVFGVTHLVAGGEEEFTFADFAAGPAAAGPAVAGPAAAGAPLPAQTPAGSPDGDHGHEFETAPLRDPFCPLVVAAVPGSPPVTCPEQAPATPGSPMTLIAVFPEGGHLHARVRVGPTVFTLHEHDGFDVYSLASLSDHCGEFLRGDERRSVCVGEQWGFDTDGP